jgi:hypothetical protein
MSEAPRTVPSSCPSSLRVFSVATSEIHMHDAFVRRDWDIILVDTPGFDSATNTDIFLTQFVQVLRAMPSKGISLSGIIYLHRITDGRMGGSATKNIQLLQELCGDQFLSRVTLVTTMWDRVQQQVGDNREKELKSSYWAEILGRDAMYQRHDGTHNASLRVIDGYLEDVFPRAEMRSNIEQQVVDSDCPLHETDAGRFTLETVRQKVQQYTTRL